MRTHHSKAAGASTALAAMALLALPFAACTSGGAATPTVTPAPSASVPVATTQPVAPTTHVVVPATETPTTTTTIAPATTIDEATAAKAAAAAGAIAARQAFVSVLNSLSTADAEDALASVMTGDGSAYKNALATVNKLKSNGYLGRPNPETPESIAVEGDVELGAGPPFTSAFVTTCTVSSGVIYQAGTGPDGGDTIINDEIVARRIRSTIVLESGVWRLREGVTLGTWQGAECLAD